MAASAKTKNRARNAGSLTRARFHTQGRGPGGTVRMSVVLQLKELPFVLHHNAGVLRYCIGTFALAGLAKSPGNRHSHSRLSLGYQGIPLATKLGIQSRVTSWLRTCCLYRGTDLLLGCPSDPMTDVPSLRGSSRRLPRPSPPQHHHHVPCLTCMMTSCSRGGNHTGE